MAHPTARPPSVADILGGAEPAKVAPPSVDGPVLAVLWLSDEVRDAETGDVLTALDTPADRGMLSGLARDRVRQGTTAPILASFAPVATALEELKALSRLSGAGLLVEGAGRELLADPALGAVPVYPVANAADLTRAAIHAQRDGAVIVALLDHTETRALFTAWQSSPEATTVTEVSAASAVARLSSR